MSEVQTDTLALIEGLLQEGRTFQPSEEFVSGALVRDDAVYREAEADFEAFWSRLAREFIEWFETPTKGLEWSPPHCTWFADGVLNVSYNCLDKRVAAGRGDKVAYHWEAETPGETRTIAYAELLRDVSRLANGLKALGVRKGDRVGIYMGIVPELSRRDARLCAHRRAAHRRFRRFLGRVARRASARLRDDGSHHPGRELAQGWQRAAQVERRSGRRQRASVERVVVFRRTGNPVPWESHDVWWHDLVADAADECDPEPMGAEDTLFLLHTSGSTAKPKGALHTTAGYLLHASVTHKWIFDIHDESVWWCAADIGWVTGHSYIVYGPLNNGATSVLYEGDPAYPDWDRHWQIVERYRVNSYYTAPTLIRSFVKMGEEYPRRHDLSSLRLLGTVGEPINPEAWVWYWQVIGGGRCPVVDTWWQTETGGILVAPLPGVVTTKPGSATVPFPGISAQIVDELGDPVARGSGGFLVLDRPWPGMFRTLFGDDRALRQHLFLEVRTVDVRHGGRR